MTLVLLSAGNAPTMMRFDDLAKVAPLWMNTSLAIFYDSEANKEWGWVQEMYAFTIACYNAGLRSIGLHKKLMAQPPWDSGAPGAAPSANPVPFPSPSCQPGSMPATHWQRHQQSWEHWPGNECQAGKSGR